MSHVPRLTSQPSCPIQFDHVWKRYRLGSHHDSLRDAIPALFKWWGRNGHGDGIEEFWALRDVSFHVAKGETLGIIGPNGAGKSTILKLLSRIIHPTRGSLAVRGRLAAMIELGGGFHPDLNGAENIFLQGTMLGLSLREIRRQYDSIVAFSELEEFLQTPVKRYSSGMEARLGFAIAAHVKAEVLLLDEVLAVGDLAFQQKCFRRIAELKDLGTTTVFISHNLEAVRRLCDRVVLLREGRVLGDGETGEMIQRYREAVRDTTLAAPAEEVVGSGPLQIRSLVLRDASGAAIQSIETGKFLRVEIGIKAGRPIPQPVFQVQIERIDGLLCHATSSRYSERFPVVVEGERMVTLDYPSMNLLPNLYQVIVKIFEGSNPIPLAKVNQGCFFEVTSNRQEQGAVHLVHSWVL